MYLLDIDLFLSVIAILIEGMKRDDVLRSFSDDGACLGTDID